MGLLTKSQKLGLTASNSLGFAHWRGPFASPGWVPKKFIMAAQRGCAKVSGHAAYMLAVPDNVGQVIKGDFEVPPFEKGGIGGILEKSQIRRRLGVNFHCKTLSSG